MKNKKIYLGENKIYLIEQLILEDSIFEASSLDEIKSILKKMIAKGFVVSAALLSSIIGYYHLNDEQANDLKKSVKQETTIQSNTSNIKPTIKSTWKLGADDVQATVYNAVPAQCNNDFGTTASMFRLNLYDVSSHKIIAMERTFMKELGLSYGDVVKIEGAGKYDGVYQIQDTMNKRFAGKHKIDILVPDNVKYGMWDNVKLYILNDKSLTQNFKKDMALPISKKESIQQMNKLRAIKTKL